MPAKEAEIHRVKWSIHTIFILLHSHLNFFSFGAATQTALRGLNSLSPRGHFTQQDFTFNNLTWCINLIILQ